MNCDASVRCGDEESAVGEESDTEDISKKERKKHPLCIFAMSKLVDKTSHTFTHTRTHNSLSKSLNIYISEDQKTITDQVKRCVLVQMYKWMFPKE